MLAAILPEAAGLGFMHDIAVSSYDGEPLVVSRSGYTGEDGFEILVPAAVAAGFWDRLLGDERVRPIGLGARNSLRLEAGLPLYGHDARRDRLADGGGPRLRASRRSRLKAEEFPGAARIAARAAPGGWTRVRVGLKVLQGAPAREGAEIVDAGGAVVGRVTSGGFSPSLGAPIAMGYVPPALAAPGRPLERHRARQGPGRRGRRPCRSFPTAMCRNA